jgi:hypothetical protein
MSRIFVFSCNKLSLLSSTLKINVTGLLLLLFHCIRILKILYVSRHGKYDFFCLLLHSIIVPLIDVFLLLIQFVRRSVDFFFGERHFSIDDTTGLYTRTETCFSCLICRRLCRL